MDPIALLGPNQAQDDEHLFHYFIEEQGEFDRPIVVGRWGTGKTSLLLHRTQEVKDFFRGTPLEEEEPWYIEEEDLNVLHIAKQHTEHKSDAVTLFALFGDMWEAEINLRVIRMLSTAHKVLLNKLQAPSWSVINSKNIGEVLPDGVWQSTKLILTLITGRERYAQAMDEALVLYEDLLSPRTRRHILHCCKELAALQQPLPAIAVEPIETPESRSEENESFANDLVSALLNRWYQRYRPERRDNLVRVHVSVPWHRYFPGKTAFADKIPNYVSLVGWTKERLKRLIAKRILWEKLSAEGTEQRVPQADFEELWYRHFPRRIKNLKAQNLRDRYEDSFDYICRHSSWRARDVIIMSRECMIASRVKDKRKFFMKPPLIDEEVIRRVVGRYSERTAPSRIVEYVKRAGGGKISATVFNSLTSPSTKEELTEALMQEFGLTGKVKAEKLFTELWKAEIIGLALEFPDGEAEARFRATFGRECVRPLYGSAAGDNRPLHSVGFVFRYSVPDDMSVNALMARFENHKIVFHPIFNEHLGIQVLSQYPIGM